MRSCGVGADVKLCGFILQMQAGFLSFCRGSPHSLCMQTSVWGIFTWSTVGCDGIAMIYSEFALNLFTSQTQCGGNLKRIWWISG